MNIIVSDTISSYLDLNVLDTHHPTEIYLHLPAILSSCIDIDVFDTPVFYIGVDVPDTLPSYICRY
jgi:hypothetical protein